MLGPKHPHPPDPRLLRTRNTTSLDRDPEPGPGVSRDSLLSAAGLCRAGAVGGVWQILTGTIDKIWPRKVENTPPGPSIIRALPLVSHPNANGTCSAACENGKYRALACQSTAPSSSVEPGPSPNAGLQAQDATEDALVRL